MRYYCTLLAVLLQPVWSDDSNQVLRIDHYVRVSSAAPAIRGQSAQIYVREVVRARTLLGEGSRAERTALFIHGAGAPAEVAFDVPHQGFSWMEYLADAGFDVFSMDMTGYGRSTRPNAMNDPCNLSSPQQAMYVPHLLDGPCQPTYSHHPTSLESDWHDMAGVVDYIRRLRRIDRLNLVAWSLGGPRSFGYAVQNPEKVRSIVVLAPAYPTSEGEAALTGNAAGQPAFNTQSRDEFVANWGRQAGCPDQYDEAVLEAVWRAMVESDPIGATWGKGVRRAPNTSRAGWSQNMVRKLSTPTLVIAGAHDAQVPPARVRELYEHLAVPQKVYVDLGCSSHNAIRERNRLLLFQASMEWLTKGTVQGMEKGVVRLGYGIGGR